MLELFLEASLFSHKSLKNEENFITIFLERFGVGSGEIGLNISTPTHPTTLHSFTFLKASK
jgi:hypothetical protein